jgi:hypothetical protein
MAIDYREKEREFLDGLEQATGRGLEAWMTAISEQNFAHRNDLIDWLRQQGFMFSKASWLERVHHNGGKPIYSNAPPPRASKPREKKAAAPEAAENPAAETATSVAAAAVTSPHTDDIQSVLAGAKGLRPLAAVIVKLIQDTVPETIVTPSAPFLSFESNHRIFAVLITGGKDLRLGLALPFAPAPPWQPIKAQINAPKIPATITHTMALSDVRQLTPDLREQIAVAGLPPPAHRAAV